MANRPCDLCRRFFFDEKTGGPRLTEGKPIPRNGSPAPCETSVGCAKGHWTREIKLTTAEQAVIDAYRGGTLTERDKRDPIVRKVMGALAGIDEAVQTANLSEAISLAILRSLNR